MQHCYHKLLHDCCLYHYFSWTCKNIFQIQGGGGPKILTFVSYVIQFLSAPTRRHCWLQHNFLISSFEAPWLHGILKERIHLKCSSIHSSCNRLVRDQTAVFGYIRENLNWHNEKYLMMKKWIFHCLTHSSFPDSFLICNFVTYYLLWCSRSYATAWCFFFMVAVLLNEPYSHIYEIYITKSTITTKNINLSEHFPSTVCSCTTTYHLAAHRVQENIISVTSDLMRF